MNCSERSRRTGGINKPFTADLQISLQAGDTVTNNERPRHRPPPDCRLHRRRPAGPPRREGRVREHPLLPLEPQSFGFALVLKTATRLKPGCFATARQPVTIGFGSPPAEASPTDGRPRGASGTSWSF